LYNLVPYIPTNVFPSAWQVVKERGFNNVTVEEVVQAGLRIQIPIISGFNWVSGSGSGFGSRRAKITHKRRNNLKYHVLKCWMISFET
jgi:hypothetical protein